MRPVVAAAETDVAAVDAFVADTVAAAAAVEAFVADTVVAAAAVVASECLVVAALEAYLPLGDTLAASLATVALHWVGHFHPSVLLLVEHSFSLQDVVACFPYRHYPFETRDLLYLALGKERDVVAAAVVVVLERQLETRD